MDSRVFPTRLGAPTKILIKKFRYVGIGRYSTYIIPTAISWNREACIPKSIIQFLNRKALEHSRSIAQSTVFLT